MLRSDYWRREQTGKRQDLLEKLYHALLSVPPTSVSSERAFSIAGNFVTPRRARMLDPTVDDLCFLHSVHARKRKQKPKRKYCQLSVRTSDITVETFVSFMVFHILISESLYGIKVVLQNTLSLRIRAKDLLSFLSFLSR